MTMLTATWKRRLSKMLCAIATLAALPLAAQAGTITSVASTSGTGLGFAVVPAINSFNEGNDNQVGGELTDSNLVVAVKRFDHTGYIDIVFNVRNSQPSGTTEYRIFEAVDNNTGINWSGYVVELGTGVGTGFTRLSAGTGLDFDAPLFDNPPISTVFSNVVASETRIEFSSGNHSTGSEIYQFRIDVPDGITSFTLRQYPVPVPEPGTLLLAGTAAVGLLLAGRRRRSRK